MIESLSVIIPVYNASETIRQLHRELTETLASVTDTYRIIYVDDCSLDDSFSRIEELAAVDDSIIGIRLAENCGQQNALLCGLRHADSDFIVTIDDDLQYPPLYIPELLKKIQEGYSLVYGIPRRRSDSLIRNMGTFLTDLLLQLLCMKPRQIEVSSFRIMDRELAEAVSRDTRQTIYISGTSFLNTSSAAVIPIDMRKSTKSRYNFKRLLQVFGNILLFYMPLLTQFRPQGRQYKIRDTVGLTGKMGMKEQSSC